MQAVENKPVQQPASYDEVAERGFIFVDPVPWRMAVSKAVQNEFREEMVNLARSMAKVGTGDERRFSRPLFVELQKVFENAKYVALITKDQINEYRQYKDSLVFLLHPPQRVPVMQATVIKPHKSRLVFFSRDEEDLCVPVALGRATTAAVYVPYPLTKENVGEIGSAPGHALEQAVHDSTKDILHHHTDKRRILREDAKDSEARAEIRDIRSGAINWRNVL